jgi:hypothetical protein
MIGYPVMSSNELQVSVITGSGTFSMNLGHDVSPRG